MASVLINSFVKGVTDWLSLIRRTPTTSSTAITVADDLERLKRMLQRIVVVLQDAEEREIVDKSVKLWLTEIKDVADDAQDLLDEYQYEVLRAQIENRDIAAAETAAQASRRKDEVITPFASSSSSASNIAASKISILSDMADRIKKIRERLDEISEDRKNLHLKPTDGQRRRDSCYEYPPPTSHMIDEQGICGREDDRKKLIDWLFSNKESKYEVLAVVGMGGLGKTTLAQLVYNVPKVEDYFQQRMWICVSRDFDPKRLTRAMIESITGDPCALSELSALQSSLQQKLDGKRVLLVLDDVWNEKQSLWETLRRPFVSAEMIRIIVTTRNISVAEVMQTTDPHRLGHLPEEQCRRLFMRLAFRDRDPKEFPSLVGIGEEIVKKCDGLPLAVKSLGALLQPEGRRNGEGRWSDEERWKEVLHSGLWDEETDILPALKLSYTRMPSVLKPCFQICSVFPKAYKFGKDELVNLWAAQGYIEVEHNIGKHNTMDMGEEIGYKYFNELRRRSFFDELPGVGKEEQRRYKMHDIIHDLACYLLEGERKMRHLSVENESPELHLDDKIEGLRTLIVGPVIYDIPVIHDMLGRTTRRRRTHLRYLKILLHSPFSLAERIRNEEFSLPEGIGNLVCLRHLQLCIGGANVKVPESIGDLFHLTVLEITCSGLVELPDTLRNLVSLTTITFCRFRNEQLPALGQLPYLRATYS